MSLGSITPILRIFDEVKAKEFYVDFLGFTIDFEHRYGDDFPLYLQVTKDACTLHLSEHYGDACAGSTLRIDTIGLRDFQQSLIAKNYKYARPGIEAQEWGAIEMTITDPFGNKLIFTESLADVSL